MMSHEVARRCIELLDSSKSVETLDLTGGAPELCPEFKYLVKEATARGIEVIDRCNLTVLVEPGQEDLAQFLADHKVRVVASMPCYSKENVDSQRGGGVFGRSIRGLQILNEVGYGVPGSDLQLDLVYNPGS
jgi:radical SAM/Cys-rich protein